MYINVTKILVVEQKGEKQLVKSIPRGHFWTYISMPENSELIMDDLTDCKRYLVPVNTFRRNMAVA